MAAERRRRGLNNGGPVFVAGVPVGAEPEKWVLAEHVEGHKIGEEVTPAAGLISDGGFGLHHMTDSEKESRIVLIAIVKESELESFCERRIQWCREAEATKGDDRSAGDDDGERSRTFKDSIQLMRMVDMDDFPFTPRTCLEYMKAVGNVAESCLAQHTMWVSQSGIPSGDRAIWEDDVLSRILDLAVKFDG